MDLRRILVYFEGAFRCEARPYQMKNFTVLLLYP